jgi:hypothetical protein
MGLVVVVSLNSPCASGCLDWRAGLGRWLYGGGDGGDATEVSLAALGALGSRSSSSTKFTLGAGLS